MFLCSSKRVQLYFSCADTDAIYWLCYPAVMTVAPSKGRNPWNFLETLKKFDNFQWKRTDLSRNLENVWEVSMEFHRTFWIIRKEWIRFGQPSSDPIYRSWQWKKIYWKYSKLQTTIRFLTLFFSTGAQRLPIAITRTGPGLVCSEKTSYIQTHVFSFIYIYMD